MVHANPRAGHSYEGTNQESKAYPVACINSQGVVPDCFDRWDPIKQGLSIVLGDRRNKPGARLTRVILRRGTGKRLWPISRATHPYQAGGGEVPLLLQTNPYLTGIRGLKPPMLICNRYHSLIVTKQMFLIGEESADTLKAIDQNTALDLATRALQATPRSDNPAPLVLASNHAIGHDAVFIGSVSAGMTLDWRRGSLRPSSWPYRREQISSNFYHYRHTRNKAPRRNSWGA